MRSALVAVFAIFAVSLSPAQADTYQALEVKDGGGIVGQVIFVGTPPAPEKVVVDVDPDICGREPKFSKSLLVGSNGGIRNAVVFLRDIRRGKKWEPRRFTLAQTGCEFDPHILLIAEGAELHLVNNDRVAHNVRSHGTEVLFNIGQPKFVVELIVPDFSKKVAEQQAIRMGCDIHRWMRAYAFVQRHPYYAVTDEKGSFQLTSVPPGEYDLAVWHETLGEKNDKVTVKPNGQTSVRWDFQSSVTFQQEAR